MLDVNLSFHLFIFMKALNTEWNIWNMFFPQRAFHHCTIQSLNYVSLRHLGSICDTDKRHIQHSKSIIFKVMAKFMQRHQVVTVQRFLSLSLRRSWLIHFLFHQKLFFSKFHKRFLRFWAISALFQTCILILFQHENSVKHLWEKPRHQKRKNHVELQQK